ncbi:MAG: hypothetical protein ACQEST_11205 [Bacteroidota bacterium]
MNSFSKYKKILFWVLIVNVALVSTHEGEFWPFSIFPMFSQAGNPWARAVVEQVDDMSQNQLWNSRTLDELNNGVVALNDYGIDTIDYANFVSKTEEWTPKRVQALRDLLDIKNIGNQKWMVTKVEGYLTENDSVVVNSTPLFVFTPDTTLYNPSIFN